ncbi:MAG: single-stranded DNA-binding protein [Candidatus Lloydbacteria bacterium CG22_combo_CG10-13_8_21_14_all_47_15]|uniref:Single-stranded DNA-binding protein n=1 Tax=Candidatus Lloydbacteria bacterium CG22_combo_CG10-13_8_21_14_all_47_15 TaxID=1974635 RepID=A0A2H0CTG3_9BACT|nr:MAG: single-stranded DNA-binding protein [Candidatus Lloydbacteria bacterium CG22_combo_CG10-13_8_21_14_all_47_15]
MYINKVFLFGNLTRDPELRSLPSGNSVVSFGLATNRVYRDGNGQKQEQTEFHNVVVFGRQADIVSQYLKKGSSAFVEGRLQTRSWEGQDGVKKYRTEIVAERVQFGPRSGGASGGYRGSENRGEGTDAPAKNEGIDYPEEDIKPEDIPF